VRQVQLDKELSFVLTFSSGACSARGIHGSVAEGGSRWSWFYCQHIYLDVVSTQPDEIMLALYIVSFDAVLSSFIAIRRETG
jgi:hypothetical protein